MTPRLLSVIIILAVRIAARAGNQPILNWTFDAPQGTAVLDASGNGRHADLAKGHHQHPLPTRHPGRGVKGGAVRIESRSKVEARKIHPLGETWALSFWCLQEDPAADGNRFVQLPGISARVLGKDVIFTIEGLGRLQAARITPGAWEHVVLQVAPGRAELYLNGLPAGELVKEGWHYAEEGGRLFFGAPDWHRQYRGMIDEAYLFAGQLSAAEIAKLSLSSYHPQATWLKQFTGPMAQLVHAGRLSLARAQRLQALGAPDRAALAKTAGTGAATDRADAAWCLAVFGDAAALQPLLELSESSDLDIAATACRGLGILGDSAAIPALVKAVQWNSKVLRDTACAAMAQLGDAGQAQLIELLADRRLEVARAAATCLRSSGFKPGEDEIAARYWLGLNDWNRAQKLGQAAAPAFVDALGAFSLQFGKSSMRSAQHSGTPTTRNQDVETTAMPDNGIRAQGRKYLVALGSEATDAVASGLEDADPSVRLASANILEQLADPSAASALAAALADADSRVVVAGAKALAVLKEPSTAAELIGGLSNADLFARRAAAEALGALGEPAAEPLLTALKQSEGTLRGEILYALGRTGATAASPAVEACLADAQWQVRARAAEALGSLGDAASVPSLRRLLAKDTDWTVRVKAAKALGLINSTSAREALARAAEKDADEFVRRQARLSLAGTMADAAPVKAPGAARLDAAPEFNKGKFVQPAAKDIALVTSEWLKGELILPAEQCTIQGESAKLQDGVIGFWAGDDIVHWAFKLPKPGRYELFISQSAIDAYAGSQYKAVCNGQELAGTVQTTAHWGDFSDVSLGTLTFAKPGTYVVSVVPTKVVKWVMNCAAVRLRFAE